MTNFKIRVTRLSILTEGATLFSERCTHVSIEDYAAGEFIQIEQQSGSKDVEAQTICIDPEEWPMLKRAVDRLAGDIRGNEGKV